MEIVEVSNFNFNLIKANKNLQILKNSPIPFQVRLSFNAPMLDTDNCPVTFSSQKELLLPQVNDLNNIKFDWSIEDLPVLRTALNTIDLVKNSRLMMFIWIGGHPSLSQDILLGQVNLKLKNFVETTIDDMKAAGID